VRGEVLGMIIDLTVWSLDSNFVLRRVVVDGSNNYNQIIDENGWSIGEHVTLTLLTILMIYSPYTFEPAGRQQYHHIRFSSDELQRREQCGRRSVFVHR
jgi:hypothetical protein